MRSPTFTERPRPRFGLCHTASFQRITSASINPPPQGIHFRILSTLPFPLSEFRLWRWLLFLRHVIILIGAVPVALRWPSTPPSCGLFGSRQHRGGPSVSSATAILN